MNTPITNKKKRKHSNGAAHSIDQVTSPKKPKNEGTAKISGRKQYQLWKKQKLEKKLAKQAIQEQQNTQEVETLIEKPNIKGRKYTVSIAVPGSIMDNAQSTHLRTYLAGQIARAAAINNVDEVVVFDDMGITRSNTGNLSEEELFNLSNSRKACFQMAEILRYLECPQYLRRKLFPISKNLENAGVLNPLDCSHHLRENEECEYREGYVENKLGKKSCSYVNVGLKKDVLIDKAIKPGVRVTVKIHNLGPEQKKLKGTVVAPHAPRTEGGLYWGYNVRLAHSLGAVFSESPFLGGYDLTIGTSDKGESVDVVTLPKFSHLLVVFGGLKGLEASLEADEGLDISEPELLFDHYLNMRPGQGSRTIRTEEAVLISMDQLRLKIESAQNLSA